MLAISSPFLIPEVFLITFHKGTRDRAKSLCVYLAEKKNMFNGSRELVVRPLVVAHSFKRLGKPVYLLPALPYP